jgi:hypothetical protein
VQLPRRRRGRRHGRTAAVVAALLGRLGDAAEQSIEMFRRSNGSIDLHLFLETDHFMFAEENTRVRTVVAAWLARFFPAK